MYSSEASALNGVGAGSERSIASEDSFCSAGSGSSAESAEIVSSVSELLCSVSSVSSALRGSSSSSSPVCSVVIYCSRQRCTHSFHMCNSDVY